MHKKTDKTGFAKVVGPLVKTYQLLPFISIYTMESYMIYISIQCLALLNNKHKIIIGDSLSTLNSLHDQSELKQHIEEIICSSKNKIKFTCVPSHVETPGNEKADTMVNEVVLVTTTKGCVNGSPV